MKFRFGETQIEVNVPDRAALMSAVTARLKAGQGFALATINLDHLVKLRRSEAFRTAYAAQDFVVADGNPIVLLSRLSGSRVALVPGSDLVVPLCRAAAEAGAKVALVGSTETALAQAAQALTAAVPGLVIALRHAPPMGFDPQGPEAGQILQELADRQIGLCFLALGAPRQEIMAARGRSLAPGVGFVSVGAGIDFLAGSQVRAPQWVRGLALEWLWRALSSPRRMVPRYAACLAILPAQVMAALRQR